MTTSNAMRQLEERHVASKVELMVWCNKMDLLALSNVRGEVALHRLSWQKVWTLAPPSEGTTVTGMAWRPDGKVIAIAYSTKELLLVDVENKETLHRTLTEAGVTCLAWVRDRGSEPKPKEAKYPGTEPAGSFLPRLPSLSRSFGSAGKSADEDPEDAKRVRDQPSLNILLVGLSSGVLHLLVFGLLACGRVDLATRCVGRAGAVVAADVTDDLSTLLVALSSPTEEGQELTLVILDTSVLSLRAHALHALALKHGLVSGLLGYLDLTMHALSEAWENVLLEMDAKLAAYAAKVSPGSVSADFLELLMLGTPSAELEAFLLQDLTEKGLKKLGHTIELSYSNIQKLVLKHLHSVGQSLTYHLAEIRGMARWSDRFAPLGLEEAAVDSAIRATGSFLAKAAEVQQVIDVSMKNYKAFFRWLYAAILRLTEERVPPEVTKITQQDLTFIADFLLQLDGMTPPQPAPTIPVDTPESQSEAVDLVCPPPQRLKFNLELLGQYLQNEDLPCPAGTKARDPWPGFLSSHPALEHHAAIIPHTPCASLAQQHIALAAAVDDVFARPAAAIGSHFKIGQVMDCLRTADAGRPVLTQLLAQDGRLSLAFLDTAPPAEGFYFLRVAPEGSDYECAYFHFQMPLTGEVHPVLEVQFYSAETLSVLLCASSSRAAIFAQVPTRMLVAQSRPVELGAAPRVELAAILETGAMRPVDNMVASRFAVSGSRKVAVVLSESGQKVRLFEMEVEDDEEEDDTMDTTNSTVRDNDSLTEMK